MECKRKHLRSVLAVTLAMHYQSTETAYNVVNVVKANTCMLLPANPCFCYYAVLVVRTATSCDRCCCQDYCGQLAVRWGKGNPEPFLMLTPCMHSSLLCLRSHADDCEGYVTMPPCRDNIVNQEQTLWPTLSYTKFGPAVSHRHSICVVSTALLQDCSHLPPIA